jgi:hypothetical protein
MARTEPTPESDEPGPGLEQAPSAPGDAVVSGRVLGAVPGQGRVRVTLATPGRPLSTPRPHTSLFLRGGKLRDHPALMTAGSELFLTSRDGHDQVKLNLEGQLWAGFVLPGPGGSASTILDEVGTLAVRIGEREADLFLEAPPFAMDALEDGEFRFTGVPAGHYQLAAAQLGAPDRPWRWWSTRAPLPGRGPPRLESFMASRLRCAPSWVGMGQSWCLSSMTWEPSPPRSWWSGRGAR